MSESIKRNEWEEPSALGHSYVDVRSMDDEQLIAAGIKSGDHLAAELANRLDVALHGDCGG